MSYARVIPVEFNHCDPAGIVFYPRYFEMANSLVETFFAEVLDYPFSRIHLQERCAVPTVRLTCVFSAPSRLGDRIAFALDLTRIGRASAGVQITGHCGPELRLTVESVLVWVGPDGRPRPWPEAIRAKMTEFSEGQHR